MKLTIRTLIDGCLENCIKLQKLKDLAISTDQVQQCKCTAGRVYVWTEIDKDDTEKNETLQ